MEVRLLGVHNLETRETKHSCFLIDDILAIDAGSLASALRQDELLGLRAVLLTHHHFDHIRDIPTVGLVRREAQETLPIHGLSATLDGLYSHVLDGNVYPDMTQPLSEDKPRFRLQPLVTSKANKVDQYTVRAFPMQHPLPSVGFIITDKDGHSFGFTGDTGGGLEKLLAYQPAPQALLVDMTFPDRMEELARVSGHLTPALLRNELKRALQAGLRIPPLIAVHRNIAVDGELVRELAAIRKDLNIELSLGAEGDRLQ